MTVVIVKSTNGTIRLLTGTATEVMNAIEATQVPLHKVQIWYNGTNISAVVKLR